MSIFYYSFRFCLAEFSRPNAVLFARSIPNLLPASHCDQLPNLILGGSHVTRGACYHSGVLQGESEWLPQKTRLLIHHFLNQNRSKIKTNEKLIYQDFICLLTISYTFLRICCMYFLQVLISALCFWHPLGFIIAITLVLVLQSSLSQSLRTPAPHEVLLQTSTTGEFSYICVAFVHVCTWEVIHSNLPKLD